MRGTQVCYLRSTSESVESAANYKHLTICSSDAKRIAGVLEQDKGDENREGERSK